jgi:hypothetical protein
MKIKGRCRCGALASERFKKRNWCPPCFEVEHNTPIPLKLEDFIHQDSALARVEETQHDVSRIHAVESNAIARRAMRKNGIPTLDPRDPHSWVIAP